MSLFKVAPKHSAVVLSSSPKCRKAVLSIMEQTHVLDKLPSGMGRNAAGREASVNESTIYIK